MAEAEPRPRARLGSRLLLVLGGTAVALGIAEVAGRILYTGIDRYDDVKIQFPTLCPAPFTGVGFGLKPSIAFVARYDGDPFDCLPPDGTVEYRTNEFGFRDAAFTPAPSEGTKCLAVIGDSFTFGEGVPASRRFTEVAAERLSVRSLNLGVPGYKTEDEAAVAAAMLPRLRPSTVVVGYCLNDPVGVDAAGEFFDFDLISDRESPGRDETDGSPFHIVRYYRWKMARRRLTARTEEWYRSLYHGADAPWVRSRRHLEEIRDSAAAVGADFAVMILPIFHRLESDYPFAREHEMVAQWCEARGIPVLDTLPSFAGERTDGLIVHPKDRHPNARAHEIMGRALADFLGADGD